MFFNNNLLYKKIFKLRLQLKSENLLTNIEWFELLNIQ